MSLKYRIAATIFVLEALMMGVILTETISRFDESTRSHLEGAENVVLNLLEGVGRRTLLTEEFASMQPYLEQVGKDPRVLRAMLADRRGVVVASLSGTDVGAPLPEPAADADRVWRTIPIETPTDNLGTVAVEFSNGPLTEAARKIRRQAVAVAAFGMSLIALVGVGTGVLLTRKLERVSQAARRLADGDLAARSGVEGGDEIGRMGRTFDAMAASLEVDRARIATTEDALKASVEHYRSLVDNAPISIHEIDVGGRVITINRAGRIMLGLPEGPDVAFVDIVDGSYRAAAEEALSRAWSGRAAELEFTRRLGATTKTFHARFYPVKEEGEGNGIGGTRLMGLAEDITERREAEKALEASEARLRQAQKMEAVGLLAGGVAHDFNNILTVINGYSDLMLKIEDLPHRGRMVEISSAARRATSLTQQLLAFSRRQVLEPRVMDLNDAVTEVRNMLIRLIGEDIDLRTDLEPNLGHVKADPGQIHQVIINLAVNARDAMPDGGNLVFTTKNVMLTEAQAARLDEEEGGLAPGDYVSLSARDTGVGMTEDILSRIFEPFFTTKSGGGTGLGLSTVYGIAKQSGGSVRVSSAPGEGSVFELLLPRVHAEIREAAKTATAPTEGGGTILLVEDDNAVRALVRRVLTEQGYVVLEATDGRSALEVLEETSHGIVLVITDVVMPIMGGAELATAIAERHPEVKILFTTGYAGSSTRTLPTSRPLLKKPFSPAALLVKVCEVIKGSEGRPLTSQASR